MASPTIEHRTLYQSEELHKYILETSVYPREHEQLRELRKATATQPWSFMCMSPDEGQFLTLLLKSMNARKTIELGVFTGYSLLATALALPEDGKAVGIDVDSRTYEEIGLPCITKAGVADKVEFIESPAIPALDEMLRTGVKDEFDFAFVDAVKQEYEEYHERLLKLVRVGGLLAYDNTLWFESLTAEYSPSEKMPARFYEVRSFFLRFNCFLVADPRIEISQLCLGDGITLCRRIV